jgi:hypothetical protein
LAPPVQCAAAQRTHATMQLYFGISTLSITLITPFD